jgi:hypothetical protein
VDDPDGQVEKRGHEDCSDGPILASIAVTATTLTENSTRPLMLDREPP